MAEPNPSGAFDRQCVEGMQALGKALGQMSLYKVGHPTVAAMIASAEAILSPLIAQTAQGELAFSIDQGKLIANGRIVGLVAGLPSSVPAFFSRFKLNHVAFKAGLTVAELATFCELASPKPGAAKLSSNVQEQIAAQGVTHIVLTEAFYTKMNEETLIEGIEQRPLEDTIKALIGNAISDAGKHSDVYKRVVHLLESDVQKRVDEVIGPLRQEKTRLENEQVRTQTVLQSAAEGVVVVDEHGRVLMMNPAAEELYGTTLAEVAGKPLSEKAGEEHVVTLAAEISTPVDRPVKTDVAVAGEAETQRTVKASTALVQNEAGKVVGMVSSLTDVAKHKELQKKEREFIAHVTHELRAPLSSIRAALDIIVEESHGRLPETESKMLKTAVDNSQRLENLINGILDFAKIESGQMTVHPHETTAKEIAAQGAESLKPWAQKRKIMLTVEIPEGLPVLWADASRTVQVLVNLLSNAIKFTPAGGRIVVRAKLANVTGERAVEFSVSDTGPGIPRAEHERIFEKFVQIASGEMHVGGTGLGLAIAKALIYLQGGMMWVDSEPGRGAAFFFTLPAFREPRADLMALSDKPAGKPWWKRMLGLD